MTKTETSEDNIVYQLSNLINQSGVTDQPMYQATATQRHNRYEKTWNRIYEIQNMNTYNPDQHNKPMRFEINESEIDEVGRPYLNYLEAAREPVSMEFSMRFSKIEGEFLKSLIEKYKIPIIKRDRIPSQ